MVSPQHRKSKAYEEEPSRLIPVNDGQCFSAAGKPLYLQQVHGVHLPHMEYRTVSMPEFLLAPSFPISGKLAIATSELSKGSHSVNGHRMSYRKKLQPGSSVDGVYVCDDDLTPVLARQGEHKSSKKLNLPLQLVDLFT